MKILNAIKFVWKNCKVWLIVSVLTIAIVFSATMVATQNDFLAGTIDTVMGGEGRRLVEGDPEKYYRFTKSTDEFKQFDADVEFGGVISTQKEKTDALGMANRLNEEITGEGIVLLKNTNGALPMTTNSSAKIKVSVFGKNSVNLVLGGSGSGAGNSGDTVSIYDSLSNAHFEFNPTLKKFYDSSASGKGRDANPAITGKALLGLGIGETPQSKYTDEVVNSYDAYSDAAIIVLSRIGGEGFDLPRLQLKGYGGSQVDGAKVDGQHYLELDQNEEDMISSVIESKKFDKVIVLINCATSMELGFIDDNDGIDAALWIGSPGGTGANAVGKILNGEINPSGRLVDTYVRDFTKDPTWNNFSDNMKNNGNAYLTGGTNSGYYFVDYEEGIYLGYRYYETRSYQEIRRFGDDGGWYDQSVVYPFGYGKSYSDFVWELVDDGTTASSASLGADDKIDITIKVTNNGQRAGKEVVQLYYSAPYYTNMIEKAHVVLGDYKKTKLLAQGESDTVTVSVALKDMASYDYNDANGNDFVGYELDSGLYTLYAGKNAHEAWAGSNILSRDYLINGFTYEIDIDGDADGNDNQFDDMSHHISDCVMSRASFATTFPAMPTNAEREVSSDMLNSFTFKYDDENADYMAAFTSPARQQGRQGDAPQLYDFIDTPYDDSAWDELIDYITLDELVVQIGQGNFHSESISSIGKPRTIDPDGPAGYTNFMGDPSVHDTCFYASECIVGATWNKDLAHDMGVMVGIESIIGYTKGDGRPYSGWYAPAVNIHRSPFSGRNWEYYSEDAYLSGIMGANVVIGAQSKGVYTFVKHFVLNDQETCRDTNGLVTWADEQTFREIYLKPFQIIVEQGKARGMMSSFNRIGSVWAGGSYALLTNVLRKEWGFTGMVISDYNLSNAYMHPDQMVRAGGDLNLSQSYKPSSGANFSGTTDEVQVKAMRLAVKNILYVVSRSNAMNGMGEGVVWATTMASWKVMLIWLNIALVLLAAVWGFFDIRKRLKKAKQST